jgi:predicted phage-related endonuclease
MQMFSTREEWLKARRTHIGASEIAALLCDNPKLTPFALSARKLGLVPEEAETKEMRRGRLLEDDAVQCLIEDNPTWDVRPNVLPHLRYWTDNHLGATPDAFVTMPDRQGDGVLQIKSVHPLVFKKEWVDDEGTITPPLSVAIQASVEAALTGCQYAFVAPLRVDWGLDVDPIEIPIVDGLLDRAKEAAAAFWAKVDNGEMYEPDFTRDIDVIASVYRANSEALPIDLSADNEVRELASRYRKNESVEKECRDARTEIKAKMLYKMNGASIAVVDGDVFATLRTVNKKAYTVKPMTYRMLTFKHKEEPQL